MRYIVIKDEKLICDIENHLALIRRAKDDDRTPNEYAFDKLREVVDRASFHYKFNIFRRSHARFLWRRDREKCYYCKQPVDYKKSTLDHKTPWSRSGALFDFDNLVTACKWCNEDKGILTDGEYRYKQLENAANGIYPPNPNG